MNVFCGHTHTHTHVIVTIVLYYFEVESSSSSLLLNFPCIFRKLLTKMFFIVYCGGRERESGCFNGQGLSSINAC